MSGHPPSRGLVGFSGSRSLSPFFRPLVTRVVARVVAAGCRPAVGCAAGADAFVRASSPGALVFRVVPPLSRAAFVRRSVELVAAVASGGRSSFCVFVSSPCPPSVSPSPISSRCFCGGGSGSWATAAFAAGAGCRVSVFWCAPGPPRLPFFWGDWSPVAGWSVPAFALVSPVQASLF